MNRHDELILLLTVLVVSRTSTNYFSKEKTCTLHEKASLMIIRLTQLKTLNAFQLKFHRLFVLNQMNFSKNLRFKGELRVQRIETPLLRHLRFVPKFFGPCTVVVVVVVVINNLSI